jgi:hypothetical protein
MANEFKIRKGLIVEGASGGTVVDVQGSQGQLFSVTDDLSGSIFAVSDISGVPILDVNSSGLVTINGPLTQTGGGDSNFSGDIILQSATPKISLIDTDAGDSFSVNNFTGNFVIKNDTDNVDSLIINGANNATFAGTVSISGNDLNVGNGSTVNSVINMLGTNNSFIEKDTGNDLYFANNVGDKDIKFRVKDDTTNVIALTIDGSEGGNSTFTAQVFSAATSSGDASSTLTTKGYVDGLITGATIYRGTWQAGISATSSGATTASTTLTVSAAILDAAGNTPDLVGAVVTGAGITGTVKVATVTSSTVYELDTAIDSTATAYIFSPIHGAPDLSGVTETSGYYYICSEAGSATPNGAGTEPNTWGVGDWVIWNDDVGSGEWQKVDNSSVLSGVGTGQTVALWEGPASVTDSETLGNAPITVSGNDTTFAQDITARVGNFKSPDATSSILMNLAASDTLNAATFRTTATGKIFEIQSQNSGTLKFNSTSSWFTGKIGVGTNGPVADLQVLSTKDGMTNGLDTNQLKLSYGASVVGAGSSVAFGVSSNLKFTGAKIVHERTASNSVGDLTFWTRQSGGTSTDYDLTIERMRIKSDGNIQLNAYGAGTLVTDASGNITVSSGGGAGGPYLPLSAGLGSSLTDNLYINDVDQNNDNRYGNLQSEVGFTRSPVTGNPNQWFKVVTLGGSPKRLKFSIIATGDNTNSYDNFLISTSGYGMNMHIEKLPGGRYNTSKLKSVAAINPSNGGAVEIWIKLEAVFSGTGATYVACTSDVLDATTILASATTTAPTLTSNDTQLDISGDNRNHATIQTSRGATFGAKVGIGTNSPAAMLTVAGGDATISGNVGIGTTDTSRKLSVFGTNTSFSNTEIPATIATIVSNQMTDNNYHSILQLVAVRASLTSGQNSNGYLGFSTMDDSNNQGVRDAGRIAIVNENGSARNSPTALTFWTNTPGGNFNNTPATEKMRIASNGNVGIGTNSPSEKLTVDAQSADGVTTTIASFHSNEGVSGDTAIQLAVNRSDSLGTDRKTFLNATGAGNFEIQRNGSTKVTIDGVGNVGIGTNSPSEKLEVDGNVQIGSTVDAKLYMVSTGGNGNNERFFIEGYADGGTYGGGFKLSTRDDVNIFNTAVTVNRNGNVGIGTTNPRDILEIEGNMRFVNGEDHLLIKPNNDIQGADFIVGDGVEPADTPIMSLDGQYGGKVTIETIVGSSINADKTTLDIQGSQGQLFSVTDDLSGDIFSVADISGVPIMNVNSDGTSYFDGNVGIGTDSPGAKLHVVGKQMITTGDNAYPQTEDYLFIGGDGLGSANASIYIGNRGDGTGYGWRMFYEGVGSGNNNKLKFVSENLGSPVDVITMLQDGNVGIGTTSPTTYGSTARTLEVRGASGTGTGLVRVSTADNSVGGALYAGSGGVVLNAQTNNSLSFATNNSEKMRITSGGNVGIGTTDPLAKLQVNSITASTMSQVAGEAHIVGVNHDLSDTQMGTLNLTSTSRDASTNNQAFGPSLTFSQNASKYVDGYEVVIGGIKTELMYTGNMNKSSIMSFYTHTNSGLTPKMSIAADGNVGIGTTDPGAPLDVNGDIRADRFVDRGNPGNYFMDLAGTSKLNHLQVNSTIKSKNFSASNYGYVLEQSSTKANPVTFRFDNDRYRIYSSDGEALTVLRNKKVGIIQTNPTHNLDVTGDGRFTSTVTATNFILSSDERLKENVEKICDNIVEVDWKTFELKTEKGQKRYGVIAQELEKTNPEFVREDSQGFKSVAYIDLLIAKIAELEARLEKLEK